VERKSKDEGARTHRCTKTAFFTSESIAFEYFLLKRKSEIERMMRMIHITTEVVAKTSR